MDGQSHGRIGFCLATAGAYAAGMEASFVPHLPTVIPLAIDNGLGLVGMAFVAGGLGAVAALVPDLDTASKLGDIAPGSLRRLLGDHRHFTHSALGVLAMFWVTAYGCAGLHVTSPAVPWLIRIGILSHLAADAVTVEGVRPFWAPAIVARVLPHPLRRLSGWQFRVPIINSTTRKWPEPLIVGAVAVAALGFVAWNAGLGRAVMAAPGVAA